MLAHPPRACYGDHAGTIQEPARRNHAVSDPHALVCPYCGVLQPPTDACVGCGTALDAETRRETAARMGPWFIRSEAHPYMPGCSWQQMALFVSGGVVTGDTIIRGPTSRQLWTLARRVPGIAHLLGFCHACRASVDPALEACPACRASFGAPLDRNSLGLPHAEEAMRAHMAATPAQRLSAFATDDELREGLHEEIRRRRSLGTPVTGLGSAPLAAHNDGGGHAHQSRGGGSGNPHQARGDGTGATLPGAAPGATDPRARARVLQWALIATPTLLFIIGACALLLRPSESPPAGGATDLLAETELHAGGVEHEHLTSTSAAGMPSKTPVLAHATGAPETAPAAAAANSIAPPAATASPPIERSPASTGSGNAQTPSTDPLAPVDALLRRARDPEVPRQQRLLAVDEAARSLEALSASGPTAAPETAIADLRARIDAERRRIHAEIFLRGEGNHS